MARKLPIFYSALLLTLVNLLLRFAGTSFQVYISGKIGPEGIGLLQLVLSVQSLALVAGIAGIRTAAMYLTAEELGRKQHHNIIWILSGCFGYSLLFSGTVAGILYGFAPQIAEFWIGNTATTEALRLFAAFLPAICLAAVMTGYFTAANRIGTLAAVEVAEQMVSMVLTISALKLFAGNDPARACLCVVFGSCASSVLTLAVLMLLRIKERPPRGCKIPVKHRLMDTALPLAAADLLKAGINTVENLMVPRRLALNSGVTNPLGSFGLVTGMVFPVLMFPACILFGLAELLVPELARCNSSGSITRIRYLTQKSLRLALLYGLTFGGLEFLLADTLCLWLYRNGDAGSFLKLYALLIPLLYCDAITDAMTKGLGQQKICVRYNIFTSALDVLFLFLLLPRYGMKGYFLSFTITHVINFLLSILRLQKITGQPLPLFSTVLSICAAAAAILGAESFHAPISRAVGFLALYGSILCLFGVTGPEDLRWIKGLLYKK